MAALFPMHLPSIRQHHWPLKLGILKLVESWTAFCSEMTVMPSSGFKHFVGNTEIHGPTGLQIFAVPYAVSFSTGSVNNSQPEHYHLMTSRLWSNPNARAAIKTLTWFPLLFFFLENGYSTATVQGRSMQVIWIVSFLPINSPFAISMCLALTQREIAHIQSRFK
jgi:hypothetical protein